MPDQAGAGRSCTLFLCGDVMTGRGVDQILPHPSDPRIFESWIRDARDYVALAEEANGPISRPVDFSYIWGDALEILHSIGPDVRIINLETAVTVSEEYWRGKGINYRMHPDNAPCLAVAGIDCCVLANNHVLDWGYPGLEQTLEVLQNLGVAWCGAGQDSDRAQAPAILDCGCRGRVVVFSLGHDSSGIPSSWAAGEKRPGVNRIAALSTASVGWLAGAVSAVKKPGDCVVASIHWGGNWGYAVSSDEQAFARALIDSAGVDIVHGHSSHHIKPFEVYRDKLILYGCGDFLNDYEGIGGYERYRADLGLMYLPTIDCDSGRLIGMDMAPTRIRKLRINRASSAEADWIGSTLNRECGKFGTGVKAAQHGRLRLWWNS